MRAVARAARREAGSRFPSDTFGHPDPLLAPASTPTVRTLPCSDRMARLGATYFAVSFIFLVPSVCPLRAAVIVTSQSPAIPTVPLPL